MKFKNSLLFSNNKSKSSEVPVNEELMVGENTKRT